MRKNMVSKITAAVLALVMCLMLTGCNQAKESWTGEPVIASQQEIIKALMDDRALHESLRKQLKAALYTDSPNMAKINAPFQMMKIGENGSEPLDALKWYSLLYDSETVLGVLELMRYENGGTKVTFSSEHAGHLNEVVDASGDWRLTFAALPVEGEEYEVFCMTAGGDLIQAFPDGSPELPEGDAQAYAEQISRELAPQFNRITHFSWLLSLYDRESAPNWAPPFGARVLEEENAKDAFLNRRLLADVREQAAMLIGDEAFMNAYLSEFVHKPSQDQGLSNGSFEWYTAVCGEDGVLGVITVNATVEEGCRLAFSAATDDRILDMFDTASRWKDVTDLYGG